MGMSIFNWIANKFKNPKYEDGKNNDTIKNEIKDYLDEIEKAFDNNDDKINTDNIIENLKGIKGNIKIVLTARENAGWKENKGKSLSSLYNGLEEALKNQNKLERIQKSLKILSGLDEKYFVGWFSFWDSTLVKKSKNILEQYKQNSEQKESVSNKFEDKNNLSSNDKKLNKNEDQKNLQNEKENDKKSVELTTISDNDNDKAKKSLEILKKSLENNLKNEKNLTPNQLTSKICGTIIDLDQDILQNIKTEFGDKASDLRKMVQGIYNLPSDGHKNIGKICANLTKAIVSGKPEEFMRESKLFSNGNLLSCGKLNGGDTGHIDFNLDKIKIESIPTKKVKNIIASLPSGDKELNKYETDNTEIKEERNNKKSKAYDKFVDSMANKIKKRINKSEQKESVSNKVEDKKVEDKIASLSSNDEKLNKEENLENQSKKGAETDNENQNNLQSEQNEIESEFNQASDKFKSFISNLIDEILSVIERFNKTRSSLYRKFYGDNDVPNLRERRMLECSWDVLKKEYPKEEFVFYEKKFNDHPRIGDVKFIVECLKKINILASGYQSNDHHDHFTYAKKLIDLLCDSNNNPNISSYCGENIGEKMKKLSDFNSKWQDTIDYVDKFRKGQNKYFHHSNLKY